MKTQINLPSCFGLLVATMLLASISSSALGTPVPQNDFRTRLAAAKSNSNSKSTARSEFKTRPKFSAGVQSKAKGKSQAAANLNLRKGATPKLQTTNRMPARRQLENTRRMPRPSDSQSGNATAQSVPNSQSDTFSQEEVAEFVQLHADYLSVILERRNEFYEKLIEIQHVAQQITGSPYVSFRSQIIIKASGVKQRIGTYGAYSITTPQQIKLRVPNERLIDDLINELEDLVDQLEDRADDRDDDNIKDLADQLDDLVDDADRLEGRLTRKTNRLRRIWSRRGGDVDYF